MARQLTETLDNLYTTTWQNMKGTVADNIFDATPFWFWLRANDGLEVSRLGVSHVDPSRSPCASRRAITCSLSARARACRWLIRSF